MGRRRGVEPTTFDARSNDSRSRDRGSLVGLSQWSSEDEDPGEGERRGRERARRHKRTERLSEVYSKRSQSVSKRSETFEEEDEAIEITRAELEKLRERIDQARSDAGYSSSSRHSSRAGSRSSSRHSSRRGGFGASVASVDPDFADEKSTTVDGSVDAAGMNVMNVGADLFTALAGGDKPAIWTQEEMDDEATKRSRNAHNIGSAVVPQKIVEKYDKAKKDYEDAVKAKREKKERLRREAAAEAAKDKPPSRMDELAQEFRRAVHNEDPASDYHRVRQRMDYKNTALKRKQAARLAHNKKPPTFYERLSSAMFGCCLGARR